MILFGILVYDLHGRRRVHRCTKRLASFSSEHLSPLCYAQRKEAGNHEAIKNQALGEGLQAYKLEKLSCYETHLDRKFERNWGILLKLKEFTGNRLG